jgi:hypothetical protein
MATEFSEQIIREAPQIEAYKVGLLEAARNQSQKQLDIPAYQAAGLSDLQQQAISLGEKGIGAYAPFIQAGQESMEAGIGTLGQAATAAGGVNVAPQYSTAQGILQNALGFTQGIGAAQGMVPGGMTSYDPRAAASFMNPYQQAVTQQALGEMRRQADIARQGQAAQAVRAGAFGGTREGVQRAEFERGVQDVMSQRAMQDYAQNYAQAQQAAQGAFESQQQRQLSGAGLLGQLGAQQANIYSNVGQGIGSLAGQYGQLGLQQASTLGSLGQAMGQAGIQQAGLGEAAQRLGLQDVSTLSSLGGMQQQAEQARLEAARATGLQQAMTPYQQLSFLSDIYKGAPSSQMALTASSAPSTSPLLQAAGLGVAGLSAAAGAQKAGLF